MAITVGGTAITFNDGTTQSTAAGSFPTTIGAVGSYLVMLYVPGSNLALDATTAGSNLRYNYTASTPVSSIPLGQVLIASNPMALVMAAGSSYTAGGTAPSGTWRKMTQGATYFSDSYGNSYRAPALYLRIS
jgi:hypothetical protein